MAATTANNNKAGRPPTGAKNGAAAYPWRNIAVNRTRLHELLAACRAAGVRYGLGKKAPTLSATPGADFTRIDCSGFVRWILYQAAGTKLPDGSVVQHDWVRAQGFKKSDFASGKRRDDVVRIAFLSPLLGGGVGHVALVLNGETLESHGGVGPNARVWGSRPWMRVASVYVLSIPTGDPPQVQAAA